MKFYCENFRTAEYEDIADIKLKVLLGNFCALDWDWMGHRKYIPNSTN